MKMSVVLKDNAGHVFEGELELTRRAQTAKSRAGKRASTKSKHTPSLAAAHPRTPKEALQRLHQKGVFKAPRELKAVEEELARIDCNFPKPSLAMALERADFLTKRGQRGSYRWVQRYPAGA
jgi:hypothetical protein